MSSPSDSSNLTSEERLFVVAVLFFFVGIVKEVVLHSFSLIINLRLWTLKDRLLQFCCLFIVVLLLLLFQFREREALRVEKAAFEEERRNYLEMFEKQQKVSEKKPRFDAAKVFELR